LSTNVYEGMFLLDSNRYARDPNGVSNEIDQIVKKCGGEILVSRLWSEQRLAYPIEGHRKGTYWLTYFKLDSLQQPVLTRACQLSECIVRNLILKVDHRLIETLVTHAGAPPSAARPASDAVPLSVPDVDLEVPAEEDAEE
jgi:small subunit ribosomal protein S6